jgi:MHS family alpha-ketoglutarate permease-like MFS transporter
MQSELYKYGLLFLLAILGGVVTNVDAGSGRETPEDPHEPSEDPVISKPPARGSLVALFTGSTLEWLDWTSYIVFTPQFAPEFFPGISLNSAAERALIVFAAGSLFRPIGGFLLGGISDLYGRKHTLILSIFLMAGGGLLFGLSPTYSFAGALAPVTLVAARAIQGLAAGGEFASYVAYLAEIVPERKRGRYSSSAYATSTLGVTLAILTLLIEHIISPASPPSWGWRVPFIAASALSIVGLYLRIALIEESKYFEANMGGTVPRLTVEVLRSVPRQAREAFRGYSGTGLRVVGFTIAPTVVYYAILTYLPTYAQDPPYSIPETPALIIAIVAQALLIIVLVPVGILSDRIGRKPLLIRFAAGYAIFVVPLWCILGKSTSSLLVVMCCALLLFALYAAPGPTAMAELFPTHVRSAGLGFPYAATVALFGGTGPLLLTWLTEHRQQELFPWYVAALSLVSLVTYVTTDETRGRFPSRRERVGAGGN